VVTRLRLPRRLKDVIEEACQLWQELPQYVGQKPSQIATWLEKATPIALYCLYLAIDLPGVRDDLKAYVTQWASITPTITGFDLRERWLPPGPQYKEILTALRNAWIDGEIDTPEAENDLLRQLLQDHLPPQA
jgi:hypothetical protein